MNTFTVTEGGKTLELHPSSCLSNQERRGFELGARAALRALAASAGARYEAVLMGRGKPLPMEWPDEQRERIDES